MSATITVKVVPASAKNSVGPWLGDTLKVKVRAPPERGRANAMLVELVAQTLGVPTRAVVIRSGHSSPHKTLSVDGMTQARAQSLLGAPAKT